MHEFGVINDLLHGSRRQRSRRKSNCVNWAVVAIRHGSHCSIYVSDGQWSHESLVAAGAAVGQSGLDSAFFEFSTFPGGRGGAIALCEKKNHRRSKNSSMPGHRIDFC